MNDISSFHLFTHPDPLYPPIPPKWVIPNVRQINSDTDLDIFGYIQHLSIFWALPWTLYAPHNVMPMSMKYIPMNISVALVLVKRMYEQTELDNCSSSTPVSVSQQSHCPPSKPYPAHCMMYTPMLHISMMYSPMNISMMQWFLVKDGWPNWVWLLLIQHKGQSQSTKLLSFRFEKFLDYEGNSF